MQHLQMLLLMPHEPAQLGLPVPRHRQSCKTADHQSRMYDQRRHLIQCLTHGHRRRLRHSLAPLETFLARRLAAIVELQAKGSLLQHCQHHRTKRQEWSLPLCTRRLQSQPQRRLAEPAVPSAAACLGRTLRARNCVVMLATLMLQAVLRCCRIRLGKDAETLRHRMPLHTEEVQQQLPDHADSSQLHLDHLVLRLAARVEQRGAVASQLWHPSVLALRSC